MSSQVRNAIILGIFILTSCSIGIYAQNRTKTNSSQIAAITPTPINTPTVSVSIIPTPTSRITATPTRKPQTTPVPTITCTGPDGKQFSSTSAECNKLNSFWTPQNTTTGNTSQNSNSTSSNDSSNNTNSTTQAPPTPTPTSADVPTATPTPNDTLSLSSNSINITLSRANAQYGLIYNNGFTITSQGASSWQIKYNEPTQGQGFYESSGGISTGSSINIRAYINSNKPNGTYTGSATVDYYKNSTWHTGPTVNYSITLTD